MLSSMWRSHQKSFFLHDIKWIAVELGLPNLYVSIMHCLYLTSITYHLPTTILWLQKSKEVPNLNRSYSISFTGKVTLILCHRHSISTELCKNFALIQDILSDMKINCCYPIAYLIIHNPLTVAILGSSSQTTKGYLEHLQFLWHLMWPVTTTDYNNDSRGWNQPHQKHQCHQISSAHHWLCCCLGGHSVGVKGNWHLLIASAVHQQCCFQGLDHQKSQDISNGERPLVASSLTLCLTTQWASV